MSSTEAMSHADLSNEDRRFLVTDDMLEETRFFRYAMGGLGAINGLLVGYNAAQLIRGATNITTAKYMLVEALLQGVYSYGLCTLGVEAVVQLKARNLKQRLKDAWRSRSEKRKSKGDTASNS